LLHITEYVLKYGPLDNYSAFDFESKLGELSNFICSGNNPLEQISNRVVEHIELDVENYIEKKLEGFTHAVGELMHKGWGKDKSKISYFASWTQVYSLFAMGAFDTLVSWKNSAQFMEVINGIQKIDTKLMRLKIEKAEKINKKLLKMFKEPNVVRTENSWSPSLKVNIIDFEKYMAKKMNEKDDELVDTLWGLSEISALVHENLLQVMEIFSGHLVFLTAVSFSAMTVQGYNLFALLMSTIKMNYYNIVVTIAWLGVQMCCVWVNVVACNETAIVVVKTTATDVHGIEPPPRQCGWHDEEYNSVVAEKKNAYQKYIQKTANGNESRVISETFLNTENVPPLTASKVDGTTHRI
uniref:Uncharacterized protein n=1 Tax=Megaselia scalaris TaxID=36166 RepID=T1GYZ4_MEGSC